MNAMMSKDLDGAVRLALRDVLDPEIGENVIDMGLIYHVRSEGNSIVVDMTTTTRGCPASGFLVEAVRQRLLAAGLAPAVDIRLTYDPPWSPDMMRVDH